MKTSCPLSWNQSEGTKENCESQDANILRIDALLTTPVTSTRSRVTYRNLFCALCHNETDFKFWHIGFSYTFFAAVIPKNSENSTNDLSKLNYTIQVPENETMSTSPSLIPVTIDVAVPTNPLVTIDTVVENMFVDDSNDSFWVWKTLVNDAFYVCLFNAILPQDLTEYVRSCVPNVIDTCATKANSTEPTECSGYTSYVYVDDKVYKNPACVACNNRSAETYSHCRPTGSEGIHPKFVELEFTHLGVKKASRCSQIPENNTAYLVLHCAEVNAPSVASASTSVSTICYPRRKDNNKACLINLSFASDEIEFLGNNSIYLKPYKTVYPDEEWIVVSEINQTYVCGTYIATDTTYKILDYIDIVASEILIKISMLCLVLQLLVFQQLPEMKNLSGKNLAAFCVTLLVALLCFDVGPILPSCEVTAVIMHYAFLSCFTWMLIMSYDCWLSLYRATKFRTSSGKHTFKFVVYCVISWCAPLLVVGPAIYFNNGGLFDIVGCTLQPGYGLGPDCFIFGNKAQFYLFFVPASTMFVGNILFFAHTAYMIYLSQRKTVNPNTRHDFRLYTRLALLMGLTWTLGSLAQVLNSKLIGVVFSVLNMSQGIFIFFGFTFKKKTLKSLMEKNKDNRFISTTLSTFVTTEMTVASEVKTQSEAI